MKKKRGISRRKFLIGSAAGGATLLAGSYLRPNSWAAKPKAPEAVKLTPTLCDGCGNWCAINVYTKGDRVWKAEGNLIAGNNVGRICAKGHALLHEAYNPDRIKSPLKRVGPNKFEPISWEQAFKEIGEKTRQISEKHGPESLFWLHYPEGNAALAQRFMTALGSPNVFSHGSTCFLPRNIGWWLTTGSSKPEHDFENTRFMLFIGRNPAAGLQLRQLKDMAAGRDRGARMVVVDPRFSEAASMGHQWIRIRPGTDLALMLAIAHVMIKEGTYQKDFVEKYTQGFEEFASQVEQYTPEWAEEKTSIPRDTIVNLAREMAAAAPRAVIHRGYHGAMGTQYKNSLQLVRAVACVNGLLGNFNQLGGLFEPPKVKLGSLDKERFPAPPKVDGPMVDGSTDPERYPLTPKGHGLTHAIPELAIEGKLKAGFVYHNNPLRTNPNPARVIEGYKKLELLVSFDYVLSETASVAHYILPESYYLERDDVVHSNHCYKSKQVAIRQAVIKPLYDTKPLFHILREMAPHLGIGKYFTCTLDEYNEALLAPLGVTLERLKKEGLIDLGGEWKPGEPKFSTPSEKLEFVSSTLRDLNLPAMPAWEEPLVVPNRTDPHSFRLIHGKQAHQTHARTVNQSYLKEITLVNDLGRVWIHPDRAKALNVRDGDCMTISSSVGKGRARARVTDGIHPECVFLPSGYGVFSRNLKTGFGYGISYNDFLPTYFEPVLGHTMSGEIIVRIEKT
ncbi:MAG: molybdopterin-dependent oxidoreductase [Desulfomonile tiedjei]|uniref:Molybdopterin-dependent oxidoreductase n=1 Tax=Desulfomonile tiedjei TaxID=2358 RepID=A0A9D6UYU3_9BACT|nr:molybdopterin-dependent oxidoreductase [Desulfomonile tiedjei]